MNKKIILLACLALFSCSKTAPSGLTQYQSDLFQLNIPANWVVIPSDSPTLPSPKVGKIELAVSSGEQTNGFSNNLLILGQQLAKTATSQRFSMLNHYGVTQDYAEYSLQKEAEITFLDDETSTLYTFTARYNSKTPKLTFLQTARVCGENYGFFLTIALPANITDTAKYEDILKSFECR